MSNSNALSISNPVQSIIDNIRSRVSNVWQQVSRFTVTSVALTALAGFAMSWITLVAAFGGLSSAAYGGCMVGFATVCIIPAVSLAKDFGVSKKKLAMIALAGVVLQTFSFVLGTCALIGAASATTAAWMNLAPFLMPAGPILLCIGGLAMLVASQRA